MAENITINQQAHINYEALNEFRLAMEEARSAVTDAIEAKVDTLIADDANKSARTIANEELAKQLVPENAKEALDTLGEIAAWIQAHPDDASAMNTAITKLQAIVAGIGGESDEYQTITAYVAAKVQELSIGNYYTKTEAEAKFVAIEENKSLMTADEHTKLDGISPEATKTSASAEATAGYKVGSITNDSTTTDFYIPVASVADIRAMFATTSES